MVMTGPGSGHNRIRPPRPAVARPRSDANATPVVSTGEGSTYSSALSEVRQIRVVLPPN